MDEGGGSTQNVRFESFEADLQSGELRKHGVRVPLQGQPFQVFAICFALELLDSELSVFMQQLQAQGAAGAPGLA